MALGYFLAYIPYAMLIKAISNGYLPHLDALQGPALLPGAAVGQLLVMPLFLAWSGWWRFGTRRSVAGRRIFMPRRSTLFAGAFAAVIVATTTLNFTFPGISLLFMLLLMRAFTLAVSPVVDHLTNRRVSVYSWGAVMLSLAGVLLALGDVASYTMTFGAVLSLAAYTTGYVGRFCIMGRNAKTGVVEADRRFFVGEHAAAPVFQILLVGLGAILGQPDLRKGFAMLLTPGVAAPLLLIGVLYEIVFIFGTSIYLHRNEYSWAVPLNRGSSLFSGIVASLAMAGLVPAASKDLPGPGQWLALLAVAAALVMTGLPAIRHRSGPSVGMRRILFVCGANTCRSPIAEAIAKEELAIARAGHLWSVGSAGVDVKTVGEPMTPEAVIALGEMGIEVRHKAKPLTSQMCREADVIYCMTSSQRAAVLQLAPDLSERTFCLDPNADIPDPLGRPQEFYGEFVLGLRSLVRARLTEQGICA